MNTREELKTRWTEVKGRLQKRWGQLTEDDLQQFRGSTNELVAVIERKTGATRQEIESFLSGVLNEGESLAHRANDAMHRYAEDASERAKDGWDQLTQHSGDFSKELFLAVRRRPAESMCLAFGVGLVAGAIFFMGRRR